MSHCPVVFRLRRTTIVLAAFLLLLHRLGADVPRTIDARAGDGHVILHWGNQDGTGTERWRVERALAPRPGLKNPVDPKWETVATRLSRPHFIDLMVTNGEVYQHRVQLEGTEPSEVGVSLPTRPKPYAGDRGFLEHLERTAFDYLWYEVNPVNGLVRDRTRTNAPASIAATGFALAGLPIAVDHGWVTRAQAAARALVTLEAFLKGPSGPQEGRVMGHHGFYYHFLDLPLGQRVWKCELSSIDTALLLAGAIVAREYFGHSDPVELGIRSGVNALLDRVDWNWMRDGKETLSMGWHPEKGFIARHWTGYNEAMILYLLGIGAARNPLPAESWAAWTRTYEWRNLEGFDFLPFAPLFGHQYSHIFVDFRNLQDAFMRDHGIDYHENSRRATLAQRAYAIRNPSHFAGYQADLWGFTASDGPGVRPFLDYAAHGAPPAEDQDGTIAPTAAGGSMPFAPAECLAVLRTMEKQHGRRLWTPYGYRDAFNLTADWWDTDVLGLDQGPILLMIANHLDRGVWDRFMRAPEIRRGLERAGFKPRP